MATEGTGPPLRQRLAAAQLRPLGHPAWGERALAAGPRDLVLRIPGRNQGFSTCPFQREKVRISTVRIKSETEIEIRKSQPEIGADIL